MRLRCGKCAKVVSTVVTDDTIVRAWIECPECIEKGNPSMEERMLKWFEFGHLPETLQLISKPFGELASQLVGTVAAGPERTVALRKLLEAKDAAVRAALNPGC